MIMVTIQAPTVEGLRSTVLAANGEQPEPEASAARGSLRSRMGLRCLPYYTCRGKMAVTKNLGGPFCGCPYSMNPCEFEGKIGGP